jgi:hypothetical protein
MERLKLSLSKQFYKIILHIVFWKNSQTYGVVTIYKARLLLLSTLLRFGSGWSAMHLTAIWFFDNFIVVDVKKN